MRTEFEPAWYLDRVYHMADSNGEGLSSVNEGPSSLNEGFSSSMRSVFDALKAPALSDLTRKRSAHCNSPPKGKRRARGKDQVNRRTSLLHSE